MNMQTAAVLFGLAAIGGVAMLVIRLRGADRPPTWLAFGHGLLALAGLGVLGYTHWQTTLPDLAQWALAVFGLAALGGATLFVGFHLRERPLPVPIIILHGLVAATGFVLLLVAMVKSAQ